MPLTYLIEVEHKIQLTHVPKESIQHLHEEMYSLQISQLVIVRVDTGTEEEPRVSPIDDLVVAKLYEVRLIFLVSRRDEAVDLVPSD